MEGNGYSTGVTVLETIKRSTDFLARKNLESPRLQAELLLAHVLKLPRMRLYLEFERELSEAETGTMRELVMRRAAREPLQQITGSTSFCGLEIALNREVLIPRPETEQLAERGWKFLQEIEASHPGTGPKALDFGTGSGCLAIALAHYCPAAQVDALEVSPAALEVARQNAAARGVAERIRFVQGEGLGAVPPRASYHLLISNPPYISTNDIQHLPPEVRDFEPHRALDGGPDGLDYYRRFALEAAGILADSGRVLLEFGDGQAEAIHDLFRQQNWIVDPPAADYTGRLRFLMASRG